MTDFSHRANSRGYSYFSRGFTLLEIIVVLAMMSILLGIAFSNGHFDFNAKRVENKVKLWVKQYRGASDESILTGKIRRLKIAHGRSIVEKHIRDNKKHYVLDEHIPTVEFPKGQGLTVILKPQADIYFFPSGQVSPFQLTFLTKDKRYLLHGDAMGRLDVKTIGKQP